MRGDFFVLIFISLGRFATGELSSEVPLIGVLEKRGFRGIESLR
jgi:hypothetical protein